MLDKFRDLSDTAKMIVIGAILAIFVALIVLVSSFVSEDSKPVVEEDNANLPYPTQSIEPTGSPSPTAEPSSEPSESPSATPTAEETEPAEPVIEYGETNLSVEDQQAAQNVAKIGMTEYYTVKKGESLASKEADLKKYFDPKSEVFTTASLEEVYDLDSIDEENYLISMGTIDYIDPVGGTAEEYKVVLGVTYKTQFNRTGEDPQILERNDTYSILLSKASGEWKITSMKN